ncbi:endopeptidase [Clostridium botulinum]|nr:endopeptidase [Clostridium botulinum]NFO90289.1 endopeptidase [Clostridium botulinum]
MIQLHLDSKNIGKNGIILKPISCEIYQVLNGEDELEMEIELDKDGIYKYISRGRIITVPTTEFDDDQMYRIYDTKKCMSSNSMIVYARHIRFDANKKVIFNKNVQGNGQQVLNKLLEDTRFTGKSDSNITDIRQYKMRSITNVISGSEEDSFINIWGGEIECNNYNFNIPLKRGKDRGIRVTFGYNLEDIEEEINSDEIVTRIYPYSGDLVLGGNTPYVDSTLISKYEDVFEQSVEMSDIKVKENQEDKEGFNTEEARTEMIKRCKKLFSEGADKVKANYVVKMQNLAKTNEYKKLGYDVLEKICLGDTVHCYNKNLDIEVSARCISYKWDCINEEFIEIELGQFISNYIDNNLSDLDNLYKKIVLTEQFITLRVDSLDNNLHAQIEITADAIREEVENKEKGLITTIEKTASGIKQEVKDLEKNTNSEINQLSDEINQRVTDKEFNSYKKQTSNEISEKISKGDDFSSEMKHNVEAFKFLFNDASDGKTEITKEGIDVYKGGFRAYDNDNNLVFYVLRNGTVNLGATEIKELHINKTDKHSEFYRTLANMESVWFNEVGTDKLNCNAENFYIDGDNLDDYIDRRAYKMLKNQGLI